MARPQAQARTARACAPFGCALALLTTTACSSGPEVAPRSAPSSDVPSATTASAARTSPAAASASAEPNERKEVQRIVNPEGEEPYAGPTATLRGVVHVTGDAPPDMPEPIPAECAAAAAVHGKLFREGPGRELADVMVAVTGYKGYVPAEGPAKKARIHNCAFSQRTYALTFGQYLEIANVDATNSYIPILMGARQPAQLVAMPHGDPVKLFPRIPARYPLIDEQGKRFMTADVFALKFATVDVTGVDGRYEIRGIPVGDVKVSALLPAAKMKVKHQKMTLKAGDNTLDITLEFDKAKDVPGAAPAPSAPLPVPD